MRTAASPSPTPESMKSPFWEKRPGWMMAQEDQKALRFSFFKMEAHIEAQKWNLMKKANGSSVSVKCLSSMKMASLTFIR